MFRLKTCQHTRKWKLLLTNLCFFIHKTRFFDIHIASLCGQQFENQCGLYLYLRCMCVCVRVLYTRKSFYHTHSITQNINSSSKSQHKEKLLKMNITHGLLLPLRGEYQILLPSFIKGKYLN